MKKYQKLLAGVLAASMMAAMAATVCRAPITLTGAESVKKSYPGFWDDYCRLGGSIQEVPS